MERYAVNHAEMVPLRLEEQRLARKEEELALDVERQTLANEEVRKLNAMFATNIDESATLRMEEQRLARVAMELEKQKLINAARADEMKAVKMEQRRLAEDAVQTANGLIARNLQEMVQLRISERSIAGVSWAGQERFAIKMQRFKIAHSIGQKLEERITLYQEQQSIVQCLRVKLEEEASLRIAMAEDELRRTKQCVAFEMEQRTVVQPIQEKLDERLALQIQQQGLAEATRTKSRERIAVNAERLQLVEAIQQN